eukprot:CAMPEP_0114314218 /NCGR_PEP_ID=MMETSP0059-20121206/21650_1 /TAXON_ID=36894 /ORGANISM="Pyramimonas parkeae, Strain CCMP726" /LENGTH=138 /DNA_ID=CAMNT_0001439263 /DNA_START=269 /DNA_END=683 /DNA_ORIENTATION=+
MGMGNNDEALRVLLHDGDPAIGLTVFVDNTPPPASNEQEVAMPARAPEVVFSLRWLSVRCLVCDSQVSGMQGHTKGIFMQLNGRVYFKVLETVGATFCGTVGKVVVRHELTNRTLIGKVDPVIMLDEVMTLHGKCNHP